MSKRANSQLRGWMNLEDRLAPALTIRLDYTFDDPARGGLGFFSDPLKKAALERAASEIGSRIDSTPAAIVPGGSNSWTISFFNPSNGAQTTVSNPTIGNGEFVVYVGAMAAGSSEAGLGGTGGYQSTGTAQFLDTVRTRGLTGFSGWGGSLALDTTVQWYAGASTTVPAGETDLYTVASHELGHVLGFGTSAQFNQLFNGPNFIGPHAVAANGGRPVALSSDLAHWAQGTSFNGKPVLMQPELINGVRYGFSDLDFAALKDIGWQVNSGVVTPPRNVSTVTVSANPTSPISFSAYTLTSSVARTGGGTATGNVIFTVAGLTVGTVPVGTNGTASISVPGSGAGNYPVSVAYSGDSTTLPAVGSTTVTIQPGSSNGTPLSPEQLVNLSGVPGGLGQLFRFTPTGGLTVAAPTVRAFDTFDGAVRSVTADVNGDGTADIVYVVGTGGGSRVRVIDGKTGGDLAPQVDVFESTYTGGLFVTAADFNGDGKDEIVVSPDRGGGGRVTVLTFQNGSLAVSANFFGIEDDAFRGGARLAAGDVNGDGRPDLIVGAGFGGGPRVAIFDGRSIVGAAQTPSRVVNDFFAFGGTDVETLRNGIFVSAGDIDGDGKAEIVFGGGPGGGPRVMVISGASLLQSVDAALKSPIANFFAFDAELRGGVRPAVKDADGDGKLDLVIGSGEGDRARVKVYRGSNLATPVIDVDVFGAQILLDGVYVG